MRQQELVLFSINHPSQYHMFKNLANRLVAYGYLPIFFIQDRGIISQMVNLDSFQFRYSSSPILRKKLKGKYGIYFRGVISLIQQEFVLLMFCLFNNVRFLLGTDIAIAHIGWILRKPTFIFTDDDYRFIKPYAYLAFPFAKHILAANEVDLNKWDYKKIAYTGNQKVSYLHPCYFKPSEFVLKKYKLQGTRYFIIRLVSFSALHDSINNISTGLKEEILEKIINTLKFHGKIIINSEGKCPAKFSSLNMPIDPQDMHSLLYYSDMLISDSQSMHIEAALMGVPSIRTNKWVLDKKKFSVIETLEKKYGLGLSISPNDGDEILKTINTLLDTRAKEQYKTKRQLFFNENTNLTDFLFDLLSNYPESLYINTNQTKQ